MLRKVFRLCSVAGLISFVLFSNSAVSLAKNSESVYVSQHISQPDELVIYEGNVAYARDTVQINAQDVIEIKLPNSAIPRSLVIYDSGKKVTHYNYSEAINFLPSSSSAFGFGNYRHESKILPSSSSPVDLPTTSISSAQKNVANWKTHVEGKRQVVLEYLLNGLSWSPVYNMKILNNNKIQFSYNAMIINKATSFKDVKIKLASGTANKPQTQPSYSYDSSLPPEIVLLYDISIAAKPYQTPSSQINADYIHELGKYNLDKGTMFIELLDKELEYKKEFVWAVYFGQRLDVNYEIKNATEELFPKGLVDVYQNGLYLGSDRIQDTLPGCVANVTFCGIGNVKVNKILDVTHLQERNYKRHHHEVELKIENLGDKEVNVKIFDVKYQDCVEAEYSIKPAKFDSGSTLWEISIPAKETKSVLYDFYSDNSYRNPYQRYY